MDGIAVDASRDNGSHGTEDDRVARNVFHVLLATRLATIRTVGNEVAESKVPLDGWWGVW